MRVVVLIFWTPLSFERQRAKEEFVPFADLWIEPKFGRAGYKFYARPMSTSAPEATRIHSTINSGSTGICRPLAR